MTNKTNIKYDEGSGNVFADLELDDAHELFARVQIGIHVFNLLKKRKLKQKDISKLLCIAQPDVSHLMNGHFNRFTTDKLMEFLRCLDQKVIIKISPHKEGEPYNQVAFET